MIELVVFDIAGTTAYDGDAVNISFRQTLEKWGIDADPAFVDTVMGLPKPTAIEILLEQYRDSNVSPTPETIDAIHADFTQRMCRYYADDPAVHEIPGAAATFAMLRQNGVKVTLNTGFFRPIADALLQRLGWTCPDVIDAVVTSGDVPHGRPNPDMIWHLMKELDVRDASLVAKVGDTKADMEEGTNAGCGLVIGVTTGVSTREQLQSCPHTHVVDSVVEVPTLLLHGSICL